MGVSNATVTTVVTLTFTPAMTSPTAAPATITRSAGSWIADGFLTGDQITVAGTGTGENNGTYTIASIDSTGTILTLAAGSSLVAQTAYAGATVTSGDKLTFTPAADPTTSMGTIMRTTGSWIADGFRQGDQITVAGTTGGMNDGSYTIASIDPTGAILTLAPSSPPGMTLVNQQNVANVTVSAGDNLTFTPATTSPTSAPATITRSAGSWTTDGFLPGDQITVSGTGTGENDGTYTIASIDSTGTILTLAADSTLVTQPDVANVTVTSNVDVPIQFTGPVLALTGSLTNLSIYKVITGSANFAFSLSKVDVAFSGSGTPDLTDATLITVGLSNFQASAASGGFGVSITGGNFGIAVIIPPSTYSDPTQYWTAVDGADIGATVNLSTLVTATVSNITVQIDQEGDTNSSNTAPPLDWAADISTDGGTTYGATIDPGASLPTPVAMPITFSGTSPSLQFSGALTDLNIDGLINGSANFGLSVTKVDLTGGNTVTGGTLIMVALSNLQASGLGFQASGGDIGVAVIEPPTATNDTRYWLAVDGMGLSASLDLGSDISVSTGSANVQVNTEGGTAGSGPAPTAIDWMSDVHLSGDDSADYVVNPGSLLPGGSPPDLTINYAMSAAAQVNTAAGSTAQFNLANVISGSASFSYTKTTGVGVSFTGVSTSLGVTNADLYQVALSNLTVNTSFGLSVSSGDIGIAAVLPTDSGDSRYWVAVTATGVNGMLDLGGELSATVNGLAVQLSLNGGKDSSDNAAQSLDWTKDVFLERRDNAGFGRPRVLAVARHAVTLARNVHVRADRIDQRLAGLAQHLQSHHRIGQFRTQPGPSRCLVQRDESRQPDGRDAVADRTVESEPEGLEQSWFGNADECIRRRPGGRGDRTGRFECRRPALGCSQRIRPRIFDHDRNVDLARRGQYRRPDQSGQWQGTGRRRRPDLELGQ